MDVVENKCVYEQYCFKFQIHIDLQIQSPSYFNLISLSALISPAT